MPTGIEWCDETWNPVTGCSPVSEGCANCWAKRMAKRLKGRYGYPADEPFRVTLHKDRLGEPLRWKRPRRIFVNSMSDTFHPDVPEEFIDAIFTVMTNPVLGAPWHTYLLLTKRPERIPPKAWDPAWKNVWPGVTVENQKQVERIPILLQIPAAVRFVSCEPMLEPINLRRAFGSEGPRQTYIEQLDWVIAGSESGPKRRPADPQWFRSLRDQCQAARVPFFLKQMDSWHGVIKMPELDGKVWAEFPEVAR